MQVVQTSSAAHAAPHDRRHTPANLSQLRSIAVRAGNFTMCARKMRIALVRSHTLLDSHVTGAAQQRTIMLSGSRLF